MKKGFVMNLIELVKIELIKVKRTLLIYLCVGSPFLITIMMFFIFFIGGEDILNQADSGNWQYLAKIVQTYWGILFLPLFVTLQTALLAGLEHKGRLWRLLYTQPVRKLDILCAKYSIGFLVITISQALLFPLTIILGMLLRELAPGLELESTIPLQDILVLNATVLGLSFLLIALHIWISLRWGNFVTAVSLGIGATVSGVVVTGSDIAYYYPWAMPGLLANHFYRSAFPWSNLAYSLGVGTLVILFGLLDLLNREEY